MNRARVGQISIVVGVILLLLGFVYWWTGLQAVPHRPIRTVVIIGVLGVLLLLFGVGAYLTKKSERSG